MNLHNDKDAFRALLLDIERKAGIRSDIIEKDYYLTLLLWELSQRQQELPAYFSLAESRKPKRFLRTLLSG